MPRITLIVTAALAILAVAAPVATATPIRDRIGATVAPQQDPRNSDNRLAGWCSSERSCGSAARQAATARTGGPAQDLRTPDTRDAAAGRGTFSAPDVTVVKLPKPVPVAANGGIDWGDVGIGAGGVLGLALLALGGTFAIAHRRRSARRMATIG